MMVAYIGGIHPPKPMMHFPPYFTFPPLFRKFQSLGKCSPLLGNVPNFSKKFTFHPPKFLMTFFKSFAQISLPIWNIFISPTVLQDFPLISLNLPVFNVLYVFLFPPTLTTMHLCITQWTY